MSSARKHKGGMWVFLDASGVLERGTDEEIKAAKKAYRKQYILNYRKKQRANRPEFTVFLSKSNGDYSKISLAAKGHRMTITEFLRSSALAYTSKTYIVPDRLQLAELKQLLSQCLNEIQTIVIQKEKYFWGKEQKFKDIEKRIEKLDSEITEKLKRPYTLEELVRREVERDPAIRDRLLAVLNSYDSQNQIA
jgi:hypothetical protein